MLNWYVLHSKPHCENLVRQNLTVRGMEAFLPLWRQGTSQGRAWRPFFPGYLFAHVDLDAVGLSSLSYLPGVRQLVYSGDEPARLDESVIDELRLRLQAMGKSAVGRGGELLRRGDHVVISDGPLAGWEAIYDTSLSSGERVRLFLNSLQNQTSLVIERTRVQKKVNVGFAAATA